MFRSGVGLRKRWQGWNAVHGEVGSRFLPHWQNSACFANMKPGSLLEGYPLLRDGKVKCVFSGGICAS